MNFAGGINRNRHQERVVCERTQKVESIELKEGTRIWQRGSLVSRDTEGTVLDGKTVS